MRWIKKYVREPEEIDHLKYLMRLDPKLIPRIKTITKDYYVIEQCKEIEERDFGPPKFYNLYLNLLTPLHKFKKENFTPGIYKYFAPYSISHEIKNQNYIPHLLDEFEKIIHSVSLQFPKLLDDVAFTNLFGFLKNSNAHFKNWKPFDGYSLLHGDLHIGNIVKRDSHFLLIDFEYLRYGAAELETANLIISCLIWHYRRSSDNKKLTRLNTAYFQISSEFPFLDNLSFKFFFIFSLSLFYLSLYLKGDQIGLAAVRKIIKDFL